MTVTMQHLVDRALAQKALDALTELDGPDGIATFLLARGVRGRRIDAFDCPISNYVRSETLGNVVSTGRRGLDGKPTVVVTVDGDTFSFINRDVYDFTGRFDLGFYPDLVADQ